MLSSPTAFHSAPCDPKVCRGRWEILEDNGPTLTGDYAAEGEHIGLT